MLDTLRELLAWRERPDGDAWLPGARRVVAGLCAAAAVIAAALLALSAPTQALGWVGWPLAAGAIAGQGATALSLVRTRRWVSGRLALLATHLGVAQVAAMQWLAGGAQAPYDALLLLWLTAGVALRPPRGGARFALEASLAFCLPLAYQPLGSGSIAALATKALVAAAIGLALVTLLARRRAQEDELRTIEGDARARDEETARKARGLEAVADAALAELSADELLNELVRRTSQALSINGAAVFLRDAEGKQLVLRTVGGHHPASWWEATGRSLATRVAVECRAASIAHGRGEEPGAGGAAAAGDLLTGVPMLVQGGRVLGVLEVATPSGGSLPDDATRFLQLAADRVAAAIERSRLNEQAHRIAETLQRSLLPSRMPELPGLALATRYRPGAAGTQVGGDLYDVVTYGDGRLGLAIGDVVGRGVEAASLMGQLRNAVQVFALEGDAPERVLERVNRLVQRWDGGGFATLLYLIFDPRSSTVTFASAGHLPPLVRAPDGSASYLEGVESLPLGVLAFGDYRPHEVEVTAGSTLLLYTDGLVEERGISLEHGLARLREAVESGPEGVEDLCDHVMASVPPPGESADDVAILAMSVEPVATGPLELRLPARAESLGVMRRALEQWLHGAGLRPDESLEVAVACNEACANVVQHAYARQAPGEILVSAAQAAGEVEIVVRDFGYWRRARDRDGRGLELMRRLMASAQVIPSAEGTTVRMRRPIADGATR